MARFQTFDDPADGAHSAARIAKLREELARRGLDGFVVPRADEHQSEYVPPNAERLPGSPASPARPGRRSCSPARPRSWSTGATRCKRPSRSTPRSSRGAARRNDVEAWIDENLATGATLAYDPWLHTADGAEEAGEGGREGRRGAFAGGYQPRRRDLDSIAPRRPAPVRPHPLGYAGEASEAKLARIQEELEGEARRARGLGPA